MLTVAVQERTKPEDLDGYAPGKYIDLSVSDAHNLIYYGVISNRNPHIYIKCQYGPDPEKWFPVVDYDCRKRGGNMSTGQLTINQFIKEIPCVIIESTIRNYWIIYDGLLPFDQCLHKIYNQYAGFDHRYLQCADATKCFVVRGFPKNGSIPTIIHNSAQSEELKKWVIHAQLFWNHPKLETMIFHQTLNAL